ncbi:hypothetical protein LTR10_008560 [Elasticomyces elasticus]|nr:hypothetical protein LTR10_008560 [Elasticomyces elasticus]KAK4967433.1 hypothetical protein LTR42_010782 [Elasticomyces elasticus]KAK5728283.1 hypothetical protein LTR15_001418 [Elasticomyces elasticus]
MSICTRCALRLQRTVTSSSARRAFSQTSTQQKHHGLPVFQESSNAELQDALMSLRSKHIIPAYLPPTQKHLIFGTKNRQLLADNPRTYPIGEEEIPLLWIDRRTKIPNRTKTFNTAIELMSKGDGKEWANLPSLLSGMKSCGAKLPGGVMGKVVRKAANSGRLGVVIQCLQQVEHTGLSLRDEDVLANVMWALHNLAQQDSWSEEATTKAMKWAGEVAVLLETLEHGGGKSRGRGDARTRAEVIGVFLELSAVRAYKYQDGKDTDGKVKMYAERLLACIGDQAQPPSQSPRTQGPQTEMLNGTPIYHGLLLAEKVLGTEMPQHEQARRIREDYEAGLTILAQAIEAQAPKEGSYGGQALVVWRELIRD